MKAQLYLTMLYTPPAEVRLASTVPADIRSKIFLPVSGASLYNLFQTPCLALKHRF
jgi:hypothetical protein